MKITLKPILVKGRKRLTPPSRTVPAKKGKVAPYKRKKTIDLQ